MQAERQPGYPLLYSLPGFRYCDLLLGAAERAAWRRCAGFPPASSPVVSPGEPGSKLPPESAAETAALLSDLAAIERRAAQTLPIAQSYGDLLSIALDQLMLGRVRLVRAVLESADAHLHSARADLDTVKPTPATTCYLPCFPAPGCTRSWASGTPLAGGSTRPTPSAPAVAIRRTAGREA